MTAGDAHVSPCGCPACRQARRTVDRLARTALRRLEAEAAIRTESPREAAAAPRPLRPGPFSLPGIRVLWGPAVAIPTANADAFLAGRAGPLPPDLRRTFCLYAIELAGRPVYVGMAAGSTVASRLRAHWALARRPAGRRPARGDLARLQPILARAVQAGGSIAARVGAVPSLGPYRPDRKVLHAVEALAANLLLARAGPATAYDPTTWTFETPPTDPRSRR